MNHRLDAYTLGPEQVQALNERLELRRWQVWRYDFSSGVPGKI